MTLSDHLSAAASRKGGLTVLDLDESIFDTEASVPEFDLTGSIWPMKDGLGWWLVHGYAGRHRRTKHKHWLVECLTCHHEQTVRMGAITHRGRYCNHNHNRKENNA